MRALASFTMCVAAACTGPAWAAEYARVRKVIQDIGLKPQF